jgi:oligosaccharide repeat unit polymerase
MRQANLLLYGCTFFLVLLIEDGRTGFLVSAVALSVSLGLNLIWPPAFLRLIMFWQLGFLVIVCREGFFYADDIVYQIGEDLFASASRYLNGANALVLFGWTLAFHEKTVERRSPRPVEYRPRMPAAPIIVLGLIYAFVLTILASTALDAASKGRQAALITPDTVLLLLAVGVATAAAMVIPPLIAYTLLHLYPIGRAAAPAVIVLLSLPIFLIQAAMGARFFLLFSFVGMTVVLLSRQRFSAGMLAKLAGVGIVLFTTATIVSAVRNVGIQSASAAMVMSYLEQSPTSHSEGVVLVSGQIIDHFSRNPHMGGRSSALVLLFWVPREFWPDKPTMLGYWFPRAYKPNYPWHPLHSVSSSFAGDAYVDFGFWGGLTFLFLLGLAFGRLEAWTARVLATVRHPMIPFAATLFPAVMFSVRSLNTALYTLTGILAIVIVFGLATRRVRVAIAAGRVADGTVTPAAPALGQT